MGRYDGIRKADSLEAVDSYLESKNPTWGHHVEDYAIFRLDCLKPFGIREVKRFDTIYVCFKGQFYQIKKKDESGKLIDVPLPEHTTKHGIEMPAKTCYGFVKKFFRNFQIPFDKPILLVITKKNNHNYEVFQYVGDVRLLGRRKQEAGILESGITGGLDY